MGSDGETHQGIFDLSYLTSIPNMSVMAPKNLWELADYARVLRWTMTVRWPSAIRGDRPTGASRSSATPIAYGKSEMLCEEDEHRHPELWDSMVEHGGTHRGN